MLEDFFHGLSSFFSAIFSFALSILIALIALFALGWIACVLLGDQTSSEYLQRYADFYHNPDATPLGQWTRQALSRIRN